MQRRWRKRTTDPAIAAIARELLEAGEPLRYSVWRDDVGQARLLNARAEAVAARYAIGLTYSDAILARRAALVAAANAPEGPDYCAEYAAAMERAEKFRSVIRAAEATLRRNAGDE
jgi:hypothetical protein